MTLCVVHMVGSAVSDFYCDLSRLYASDCLQATEDPARYETHLAYVTPDRRWRFPVDLSTEAIDAAEPISVADVLPRLTELEVDVMVPQMFCLPGMTSYRALFDLLAIPYVGNPPDVMALAANKARAKAVVAAAGVSVPSGDVVRRGDQPRIAPPVVVKPADADNSLGVSLVRAPDEYDGALKAALGHSGEALVETFIELGREVRCGILVRDGQLVCLPLEEYSVDAARRPIRTYGEKIARDGNGELRLLAKEPAEAWIVDPDDPITERVWDVARKCHVALGCRHYSLFDFRIDPAGEPWFLEAGLYCSFARQSVISVMAKASGLDTSELFQIAINESRNP